MPRHSFSPQKNVRRSNRERNLLFSSLHENEIEIGHDLDSPSIQRTRSRGMRIYTDDFSDDEDLRPYTRNEIRRRLSTQINKSPFYVQERNRVRKFTENVPDENTTGMFERVKRKRVSSTRSDGASIETGKNEVDNHENASNVTEIEAPKAKRSTTRSEEKANNVEKEVEPAKESVDEEEEEDDAPRQYQLRERRPPPVQFIIPDERRERKHSRSEYRSRNHSSRRRIVRSDSDSTGDEEDKFERRKERSMKKHRERFMPINMTEKDFHANHHAILKERLQQSGGKSCSDIDPMTIDCTVGFDQVGGLGPHLQSLKEVVLFPMLYPEVFSKFDITPPKGVIFYGPPGTGKTLVARALANECRKGASKVAFFMRKGADCLSKWVGESERQLRLLFDQAYQMRPSIIFFDEIDGLAPVRSSKQDQIHASIVSTLLALMDGLDSRGDVVVIGATNRLDTIDPALRRPGRFDRELRFSLPDRSARKQILEIHTDKWQENKPDAETIAAIANQTSGYCGADLKLLCTESVLIALRSRYPHIYLSKEKLILETSSIRVTEKHFADAMKRITPASRRDLTIPSRRLDKRTSILLEELINSLIALRIPEGYRSSQSVEVTGGSELEKVVRALERPPTVPTGRLLICGSELCPDAGQTSFILPAILSLLDHLPVFSISVSSLLTDGRPEEALSHTFQSALRAAATGPCIILLPSVDEWEKVVPASVQYMLTTCFNSITGATPILFLATIDSTYETSSDYVKNLFRNCNCFQVSPCTPEQKLAYFQHVTSPALEPPVVFDESAYTEPPKAAECSEPVITRKLNAEEARELEKVYESLQRQMRIFLRDKLKVMTRDRRFVDFLEPVDKEDANDYYEIIKNPLCLEDMMDKIDQKVYVHPDDFMEDVYLIVNNALEYNPTSTTDGRQLRHSAMRLRDFAEELFEGELDEMFVEQLETTSRLLLEAGVEPEREKLIKIPNGFIRKIPWSVKNKLCVEIEKWQKEREAEAGNSISQKMETSGDVEMKKAAKKRKRSRGNYNLPNARSRKLHKSKHTSDNKTVGDHALDDFDEAVMDEEMVDEEVSNDSTSSGNSKPENVLLISEEELNKFVQKCVKKTADWGVSELERLSAVIEHHIESFRNRWDRTELVSGLRGILHSWEVRN